MHRFTTHLRSQFSYHFENQYLNVATKWLRMLLKGMPKKTNVVYYETESYLLSVRGCQRRLMWSIMRRRAIFGV